MTSDSPPTLLTYGLGGACMAALLWSLGATLTVVGPTGIAERAPSLLPLPLPAACLSTRPPYVSTLLPVTSAGRPSIVAFRYTPLDSVAESSVVALADHNDVGPIFGLAVDHDQRHLYAGAVVHYHDPQVAIGAIYRIDMATGAVDLWADLPAGEYGSAALTNVGRAGLGDIEIDSASGELLVANLHDGRIYRLELATGHIAGSFPHGASSEPWAPNARLFGLAVEQGLLYHGVVDSREDMALPGELAGYVYESGPDGSAMREVARFGLGASSQRPWGPWNDGPGQNPSLGQPLLADLELTPDGDLVIGLRDRTDLTGSGPSAGDALLARRAGDRYGVVFPNPLRHASPPVGTLALSPDARLLAIRSLRSPFGPLSGARWLDLATGRTVGYIELDGEAPPGGDIEALCPPGLTIHRLFLPRVLRWHYAGPPRIGPNVDVALILDMSTSMRRPSSTGDPKHVAAVEAAGTFVRLLRLMPKEAHDGDRAAILAFNARAWTQIALTSDPSVLDAALQRLSENMAEGTRLDLALDEATGLLSHAAGDVERVPAAILLTDGLPNRVPPANDGNAETTVLEAADRLKARGALIYTIGLGSPDDINPALLRAIASDPSMFLHAPDASDLQDIYEHIAYVIGRR